MSASAGLPATARATIASRSSGPERSTGKVGSFARRAPRGFPQPHGCRVVRAIQALAGACGHASRSHYYEPHRGEPESAELKAKQYECLGRKGSNRDVPAQL